MITAYIDGGSRGNPGPAGYGVHIVEDDGSVVEELHESDSELLVKQLRGEYRVKNPNLQPLYADACALVRRIGRVTFEHVRRELNKEADRLANLAMDEAAGT
jgi:probable phosphoglycerate mutase